MGLPSVYAEAGESEVRVWLGLRPLEFLYLALGTGILANELLVTHTLSMTELAGALFFFGLTASSVADRTGEKGPVQFIAQIASLFGSRTEPAPPPSEKQGSDRNGQGDDPS